MSTSNLPAPTPNVSALAREHGVSASTIRRWLAKGWTPAPVEVLPPCPSPVQPASTPWRLDAIILVAIAAALGALALAINAQTGWRFGTTTLAAATFASLSVAADLLAIILPSTGLALWRARRLVLATTAWTTWTIAAMLAALGSLGFVELHTSDTAAARHAIIATSTALANQREAGVAAAQVAAEAATKARVAECDIRGPRCRDREADERRALAALNDAIAAPVPTVATIGAADPQVTAALRLATWAGLKVTADDVVNLRLALMATLANIAGLVLAFGIALRRSARGAEG
jgi:hypothetical protein